MKNMKIPIRPAPSVEEARRKPNVHNKSNYNQQSVKKKPPPRPPPPDFSKLKTRSAWNLNQHAEKLSLIEWSPPSSPKSTTRTFGGSISSSFSSSTSSLASSKKSFEYDPSPFNISPWNNNPPTSSSHFASASSKREMPPFNPVVPQFSVPTIIRGHVSRKYTRVRNVPSRDTSPIASTSGSTSPPMPSIPPPSPPKDIEETISPFGIALYNFPGTQIGDLPLQVNDIVILLRRINNEWLYGRVDNKEGMFPANFIDIQVPLPEADNRIVTALYEFHPQMPGDLALIPGQLVHVLYKISNDWLAGESNGQKGQFPANFVDRIPTTL